MRKQTCNHLCPTSAILPCTALQGGSQPAWDPQILNHRWLEGNISGKKRAIHVTGALLLVVITFCLVSFHWFLLPGCSNQMGVSKNRGGAPKMDVFIMETPIKMDDFGRKSPIFGNPQILPNCLPPTKKKKTSRGASHLKHRIVWCHRGAAHE